MYCHAQEHASFKRRQLKRKKMKKENLCGIGLVCCIDEVIHGGCDAWCLAPCKCRMSISHVFFLPRWSLDQAPPQPLHISLVFPQTQSECSGDYKSVSHPRAVLPTKCALPRAICLSPRQPPGSFLGCQEQAAIQPPHPGCCLVMHPVSPTLRYGPSVTPTSPG